MSGNEGRKKILKHASVIVGLMCEQASDEDFIKWVTPMVGLAANAKFAGLVQDLLDVCVPVAELGTTSYHVAIEKNMEWAISSLVESGADIEARNAVGSTPLSCSAAAGSIEFMKALLRQGADVNSKNQYGNTPLHFACMHGQDAAAHLLLQWGADKTILDNGRQTPRDLTGGRQELAKLLDRAPLASWVAWRRRRFLMMCVKRGVEGAGSGGFMVKRRVASPASIPASTREFDGVVMWLINLQKKADGADEKAFRHIVGFL